jgi:hypothetical protein
MATSLVSKVSSRRTPYHLGACGGGVTLAGASTSVYRSTLMIRLSLAAAVLATVATLAHAQPALPSSFQEQTVSSPEGAEIFVRWAGKGPVVLLVHGYAENSDSWAPLAADLVRDHTVVVPDLRGIGRSSKPEGGYDKKTQAEDMRAVVTALGHDRTAVVAHSHRDDRVATVISGTWRIGYGDKFEEEKLKALPPGSFYTEAPGRPHFAATGDEAVVVQITGFGPSSTDYVDPALDPREAARSK